jgi:hypothetical protein
MIGHATPDQSDLPAMDSSEEDDAYSSASTADCDFLSPPRRTPSPIEIEDMDDRYQRHRQE